MSNPALRNYWQVNEECETFNKFTMTLMRMGLVDFMTMDVQVERVLPYNIFGDQSDLHEHEHIVVVVAVVVGEKEEVYEVYDLFA